MHWAKKKSEMFSSFINRFTNAWNIGAFVLIGILCSSPRMYFLSDTCASKVTHVNVACRQNRSKLKYKASTIEIYCKEYAMIRMKKKKINGILIYNVLRAREIYERSSWRAAGGAKRKWFTKTFFDHMDVICITS